jgi:ElaB/YqjD/DUF883 family membrane-anchored ribosome-binding protein
MASEPIPEPLTNQELDEKRESEFPASRTRIADNGETLNAVSRLVDPTRELMPSKVNPQLNKAAEAVGNTLGRLVNQARGISAANDEIVPAWAESAQTKAEHAKQKASRAISDVQEGAAKGYRQTKERMSNTLLDAKQKTTEAMQQARVRAREIAYNYPLEVIAGSVAAGFIVGALLRVWRSSRYE